MQGYHQHSIATTPDDEGAVSLLMRILAATGRRAEALRRYHVLCAHLTTSLGANPVEDLQYLATVIRNGKHEADMRALLPHERTWQG
jgi:DNA-binding SARP family transcriptional activator